MKIHKCYFCNYETKYTTSFRKHILKQTKCSYLIRTSEIKIENLDDYYKYVELHKTDPNNNIFGIDYDKIKNIKYYDSSDDEEGQQKVDEFIDKMVINKTFSCDNCGKNFNRKDNLKRHYNSCKNKEVNKIDNDVQNKILELEKQIEYLKNKNCLDDNNTNNSNNNNNNNNDNSTNKTINTDNSINHSYNTTNNITNNNTIVIKLSNYGEEDRSLLLDEKRVMKYLKEPFNSIPNIIEKIHFSPQKRPSNCNIRINNISNGKIQVFDNQQWRTKIKSNVIKDLINEYAFDLIKIYDKYYKNGKIKKLDIFEKFKKQYYNDDKSFIKSQEQLIDCKLIDLMKKHKDYLNGL